VTFSGTTFCFNPRAREGRDASTPAWSERAWSFNPRAREGRDSKSVMSAAREIKVSIHAPAKGATAASSRQRGL